MYSLINKVLNLFLRVLDVIYFWPAYFLHELAHFMAARLLGVRDINFSWEYSTTRGIMGFSLHLGSNSEYWKRFIVGFAPMVLCGFMLVLLCRFALPLNYLDAYIIPELIIMFIWAFPTEGDLNYINGAKQYLRG